MLLHFQSCYATRADTCKHMTKFRLHSKALLTITTSWQLHLRNTKETLQTKDILYTKETVHNQFRTEIVDLRVDLKATRCARTRFLWMVACDILGQLTAPPCAQCWMLQAWRRRDAKVHIRHTPMVATLVTVVAVLLCGARFVSGHEKIHLIFSNHLVSLRCSLSSSRYVARSGCFKQAVVTPCQAERQLSCMVPAHWCRM